jgi:gas vesicle protein GvpL/GvpF
MAGGEPDLARLKALLTEFARDEVDSLLTEAREDARREAKSILSKIMLRELLDAAAERSKTTGSEAGSSQPASSDPRESARSDSAPERAVYVYAITDVDQEVPKSPHPMDRRYDIRSIDVGDIRAIVSNVTLDEFGEDALRQGLNDLQWLEGKVKDHERVIDAVREQGSTVPMRFCTIYRDDVGVRALLVEHHSELKRALTEVSGRAEYGVKALVDHQTMMEGVSASDPEVAAVRSEVSESEGGKSYFLTKRLNDTISSRTDERLREICNEAHVRLCDISLDARVTRPQSKELTGEERDMVMNCSYLIDEIESERFLELVRELNREHGSYGLAFEATGPWPPYSFLTLDLTDEGRDEGTAG